ncbi:MAG TPA: carboxymuconolactone decarboxylase family protein [Verrucomicrobiae bacterium]|nr:carboxymuconolactone decarboxylase family protein [Verrucomicrobiae bacterium]
MSRAEIDRAAAAHMRVVMQSGTVAPQTKELCALMVSWLNVCDACVSAHAQYAQSLGIPQSQLDALFDYARAPEFDDPTRAALAATVALTREPRALPPALRGALERHYDAEQIYEIVSAIALYNGVTRVGNATSGFVTSISCAPTPAPP